MTASGGIIQLSARGKMSAVLHDSASHTLWRSSWVRYSPSALDDEILELSNSGLNTTSSTTLARYGDLVTQITLMIDLPGITQSAATLGTEEAGAYYVNCVGLASWDSCALEIGGSTIHQIYSDTCFVYEELAGRSGLRLEEAIARYEYADGDASPVTETKMIADSLKDRRLYVPIPLWFSRFSETYGNALPLVALMYHEVRFKLTTRTVADIAVSVGMNPTADGDVFWTYFSNTPIKVSDSSALTSTDVKFQLLVTYTYLDSPERASASSTSHTYLVATDQRTSFSVTANETSTISNKLYFSHVATSLQWYYRPTNWNTSTDLGSCLGTPNGSRRRYSVGYLDRFDFSAWVDDASYTWGDVIDPVKYATLQLNGHDRWPSKTYGNYFRLVCPQRGWKQLPSGYLYTYPFSMSPASYQPTASLNLSRIDHVSLDIDYASSIPAGTLYVEVITLNLLLVQNGLGGLRWSS